MRYHHDRSKHFTNGWRVESQQPSSSPYTDEATIASTRKDKKFTTSLKSHKRWELWVSLEFNPDPRHYFGLAEHK